ncbi:MAG: PIN domain-containing protein [Chloroflexota bacterium]
MSYVVTDASLWVARLAPQDAFHGQVRAWLEARRAEEAQLLAPALLLAEVGGAIARRTGEGDLARQAASLLENLPGLRLVAMDEALLSEAARLAADLGLRGADATYVAVASQLGLPLASLDADQRQRAGVQVRLVEL